MDNTRHLIVACVEDDEPAARAYMDALRPLGIAPLLLVAPSTDAEPDADALAKVVASASFLVVLSQAARSSRYLIGLISAYAPLAASDAQRALIAILQEPGLQLSVPTTLEVNAKDVPVEALAAQVNATMLSELWAALPVGAAAARVATSSSSAPGSAGNAENAESLDAVAILGYAQHRPHPSTPRRRRRLVGAVLSLMLLAAVVAGSAYAAKVGPFSRQSASQSASRSASTASSAGTSSGSLAGSAPLSGSISTADIKQAFICPNTSAATASIPSSPQVAAQLARHTHVYSVPKSNSAPDALAIGPNGTVWFTECQGNAIGMLQSSGHVTQIPLTRQASHPDAITRGGDGGMWFTEAGSGRIGEILNGKLLEYKLPSVHAAPDALTEAADGSLVFTEPGVNKIGRIVPGGHVTQYAIPTANSGADAITAGPHGSIWFAETLAGKIGEMNASGKVTEYPVSGFPNALAFAPNGKLWVGFVNGQDLASVTSSGTTTFVTIPNGNGGARQGLVANSSGVWFAEPGDDAIGNLSPNGSVQLVPMQNADAVPYGLMTDSNGGIWWTEAGANQVGRLS